MSKKLSGKTVDALLDKLSTDDEFRKRFQANPRAATRSLGTDDAAVDQLPETPIARLADKKAYAGSRKTMSAKLTEAGYPFQPITLDVPDDL